jgi:hypothetical protein
VTAAAERVPARVPLAAALVAAAGTAMLTARPPIVAASTRPVAVLGALFVVLAAVAAGWPVPRDAHPPAVPPRTATALGVGAVLLARVLGAGRAPGSLTVVTVALGTLAAVSEELWFRRFLHGLLEPAGATVAVTATAALFALVHVPIYGWGVLPLDLAAGLVLGWQRAATGSWAPGAVTHTVANVVVLL